MVPYLQVIDAILGLRPVKWGMALAVITLSACLGWTSVSLKLAQANQKTAEANSAWLTTALNQQNDAIRELGIQKMAMDGRLQAAIEKSSVVRVEYRTRAEAIMEETIGGSCEEVAAWGVHQGLLQSEW